MGNCLHVVIRVRNALVITIFAGGIFTAGAQNYLNYSGFTTPTTPILPSVERHPSLFFDSLRLDEMRARKSNPSYASIWSRITSRIGTYKGRIVRSQDENDRPRMAKYCAFAWIMNGDIPARDTAIQALMAAYDGVPQTATAGAFDDPYDEIYRAVWIQNYCEAYDWIEDQLTSAQRDTIRRRIATEAALLCDNMRVGARYAPRPHNHRSKPAYGLATAALTLTSHPNAARWLDSALTNINTVTKYQFSADGIYREGSHYYVYTNVNTIPFLWHYKNVSGVDLFPCYQASFEWPVLIRDQRGWMPNQEDGNVKPMPTHMVAGAYRSSSTRLHSTEPLAGVLQWNWATTNFFTVDYTGATNDVCWDIDEFLLYDSSIPSVTPDVDPTVFLASGQVVFRNRWSGSDSSSRYLFFHAVAAADNHDHPDQLSYIINARNTCMAVDAGYGQDQSNYETWYKKPWSHNFVTVNNTAPTDFLENVAPPDRHALNTTFFDLSEKEAKTSAANGTIRRGVAFVDNNYWLVYDRPAASVQADYRLNIHARGTLSRTANLASWSISQDSKYGSAARLHAYVAASETPAISEKTGTTCLFKDSVPQTYVEVQQVKDTASFLHLLWTTPPSDGAPAVTDLSAPSCIAFEFSAAANMTDIAALRRSSTEMTAASMTTDGIFAWARHCAGLLHRYAFTDGTMFRWNGNSLLQSSASMTAAVDVTADSIVTLTMDSVAAPVSITLAIANARSVTHDGVPIAFSLPASGSVEFTTARGGTIVVTGGQSTNVNAEKNFLPAGFTLHQNFPNPFNPETRITCELPEAGALQVRVYSLLGQCVRTLWSGESRGGTQFFRWDGTNDAGRDVSSGMYVIEVTYMDIAQRVKAMLIR